MANIQTYLNKIKNAIYGRDVRDSIHDAIDAINTESENTKDIIEDFVGGELDTTLTSTTLPAQGKAVGDVIADVKTQLNTLDGNATIQVKNLVKEIIEGYFPNANSSGQIVITTINNRAYVRIPVKGGQKYSLNSLPSTNFSWWAYTNPEDGKDYSIEKITSFGETYIIEAPQNATVLYISNTGWNANTDLIVLEGEFLIVRNSIVNFPLDTLVEVYIPTLQANKRINDINRSIGTYYYTAFERGSLGSPAIIEAQTPSNNINSNYYLQRVRTPLYAPIALKVGDSLSINGNTALSYSVYWYNSESRSIEWSGWLSNDYTITSDRNYWVQIRRANNAEAGFEELTSTFTIKRHDNVITNNIEELAEHIENIEYSVVHTPYDNYLLKSPSIFPTTQITQNGVVFTPIDSDTLHIEGTASASIMRDLMQKNYFIGDMVPGKEYYLSLKSKNSVVTGPAYYGARSLLSDSTVTTMEVISIVNGNSNQIHKITVDENAIGLQVVFYVYNGASISGDYTLGLYKVPDLNWVNDRVDSLITKKALPEYYYVNDYFPERLLSVRNTLDYANGLCFAFITDVHFPSNASNSKYMLQEIIEKTPVPFVIYGGDTPALIGDANDLESIIDELNDYMTRCGKENWYAAHGNHDIYCRTNTTPTEYTAKTSKEVYNIMMRNSERIITNVSPDHLCYCIDIPAQKSRFIMLNTTDQAVPMGGAIITSEQIAWLGNVLTNISNTKIVIISHIPTDASLGSEGSSVADFQSLIVGLKNKSSVVVDGASYDFTNTTNEIICCINGHLHRDVWHTDRGVLSVVTTCDAAYTDDGEGMVRGTITEQALDVYCIDYDNHTIKTIRFGRGSDRGWDYVEGIELT